MKIIDNLEKAAHINIYLYDKGLQLYSAKRNRVLKQRIETILDIDPLFDFDTFQGAVKDYKESCSAYSDWLEPIRYNASACFYGHLQAFAQYAGLPYDDKMRFQFPSIEHGIYWLNGKNKEDADSLVHCLVSQGGYRHDSIREMRDVPHYMIGPYIHYAQPAIGIDEEKALKQAWGRTLLVIPAHSYEGGSTSFDRRRYVEAVFQEFANDFDTMIVSAYWNDADDEIFDLFKKNGARVVSAGLRCDERFLPRLKSLIRLSDCVTGNTLGTHIGYCCSLERPFIFFEGANEVEMKSTSNFMMTQEQRYESMEMLLSDIRRAFSIHPCREDILMQTRIYEAFWGGSKALKTPQQMRLLFEISQDYLKKTHGFITAGQKPYARLLEAYRASSTEEGQMKYALLAGALK